MASNFSKFKRGDKVKNNLGRTAEVLSTYKLDGEFMVHVAMDSGFRTDYKESDLKFYHSDIESRKRVGDEYTGDKCPKCQTPWTKTNFGTRKWKDCLPCGKTAEELLDQNTRSTLDDPEDMEDFLDFMKGFDTF